MLMYQEKVETKLEDDKIAKEKIKTAYKGKEK